MELTIIKNFKKLATNPLRQDALDILEVGYQSVRTQKMMEESVFLENNLLKIKDKKYNLKNYQRIFVIALGKCANQSAEILENILGDKITDGVVLDIAPAQFKKLKSEVGTHPFPSEQNILVTKSILKILKEVKKDDLIITIISGGGSSLLCAPVEGIDSEILKQITQRLMKKGATIGEVNIVRKHLSQIKGGQLAELVYPTKLVSLIFSDVPQDNLSLVASGPTVKDESVKADAKIILESYLGDGLLDGEDNYVSFLKETPKNLKLFAKVDNILLVSNKVALTAMQEKAESLGYKTFVEEELEGEAKKLGASLMKQAISPKSCLIWGGETTVQIKGEGQGGRNQEFVLGALSAGLPDDLLVMAVASDGLDNTDVAGALADGGLLKEIKKEKVEVDEYLENNNSYNFFKKVGGQIKTGPTGINMADFYLVLKK